MAGDRPPPSHLEEVFRSASSVEAEVVRSHHTLDPGGIRERVLREVRAFVGDAEPHDDMTMIVLKVGPGVGQA